jgi:transcriptional regulator GlxA family with amidase domain
MNKKKNVGIFIFDNVETLDFSGPYEVFSSVRLDQKSRADIYNTPAPLHTFTVSEKKNEIVASGGLKIISNYNFESCPTLDILIIPGGIGTRKLLKKKTVLNWVKYNKNIPIVATVCTGALLLAKNGMLHKKKATTHWGAFDTLHKIDPTITILKNNRYVFDKYYSSSGVSAGIDMSLHIVEKIYGKNIAKNTAKYMEYKY